MTVGLAGQSHCLCASPRVVVGRQLRPLLHDMRQGRAVPNSRKLLRRLGVVCYWTFVPARPALASRPRVLFGAARRLHGQRFRGNRTQPDTQDLWLGESITCNPGQFIVHPVRHTHQSSPLCPPVAALILYLLSPGSSPGFKKMHQVITMGIEHRAPGDRDSKPACWLSTIAVSIPLIELLALLWDLCAVFVLGRPAPLHLAPTADSSGFCHKSAKGGYNESRFSSRLQVVQPQCAATKPLIC